MSGEKKVRKRIGGQDEILRQGQDESARAAPTAQPPRDTLPHIGYRRWQVRG